MTNKEIAKTFQYLGDIMELHGENPFKIRSYRSAYITLRKLPQPLSELSEEEISNIKGIGKAITGKIRELVETGEMTTLKKYEEQTPPGVREMLKIKGFGPKKVRVIWKDLGAETVGELLYACNENRLVELKGFGQKTQEDLRKKLEYFQRSRGQYLYADLEPEADKLIDYLRKALPDARISLTGAIRRRCNIVSKIEILLGYEGDTAVLFDGKTLIRAGEDGQALIGTTASEIPVVLYPCAEKEFGSKLFRHTASETFLKAFLENADGLDFRNMAEETEVFEKASLDFIPAELREQAWPIGLAASGNVPELIDENDIKGVVHAHSTYSDGLHSLREMAEYARDNGYEYLAITDHSKSAFYANGLKTDRLEQQWAEIDQLNGELAPFRIFKGIESDILNDGSLDYPEETLRRFDLIIASVHSNLRMDKEKATDRIVRAVENPHTRILGHPTGRLLLSRLGYPLDHMKIIDACAENGVAIELNANPYRLDLDWTWIPYALEKGVLISINPDAHSTGGINDIHFGVLSARKGGLPATKCLTAFDRAAFAKWLKK